jgi:DNA-binding PadR family transcriptional regulator
MAQVMRGSDGFGREIVLGLVVEQPSNCYQLDRRLAERFGAAGYSEGTARHAAGRLCQQGYVRAAGGADLRRAAGGGIRGRTTVYEATQTGIDHFTEWMWASVSTPPVREELHAKIALCRPGDLPRMVEVVREAEAVCTGTLEGLNWRLRSHRRDQDPEDFRVRMSYVVSTGDQAWWESRIKWLQKVRTYLEGECDRYRLDSHSRTVIRRLG